MKGLLPLFLGVFGTFAFSWVGLTVIPNYQIGNLDPQTDEEGQDPYPAPKSGMVDRGRHIYTSNGCFYCHSQQLRPEYAASDIDRTRDIGPSPRPRWGERRSAPRDYLFERPALLGKMRVGPDLANIGKSAPAEDESAPLAGVASTAASPAQAPAAAPSAAPSPAKAGSPAASPSVAPSAAQKSPAPASPAPASAPPAQASPSNALSQSASPAASAASSTLATSSPTTSTSSPSASPAAKPPPSPAANASPAASSAPAAANTSLAASVSPAPSSLGSEPKGGGMPAYSVAWHHQHLYSPRSLTIDSNMPAYRFLYEKRRIEGEPSADALKLTGRDAPPEGWEIVSTYDAKCLVAYLMSLDQSHPLKEVKSAAPAATSTSPAPAPAAASPSPK
jgi:cbb3-type cytochrome oxidase cytochrome c subunit